MTSRETHSGTKTWALVLTSAASFMMVLDAIVVVTALGAIRTDLGASVEALEWILNARPALSLRCRLRRHCLSSVRLPAPV